MALIFKRMGGRYRDKGEMSVSGEGGKAEEKMSEGKLRYVKMVIAVTTVTPLE